MNRLTLPLPISENRAWRSVAGVKKGMYEAIIGWRAGTHTWKQVLEQVFVNVPKSAEYNAWIKLCELPLAAQRTDVLEGEVKVEAVFYFDSRRGDMPNRPKVLLDLLQGVCYKNDSQIWHAVFIRKLDKDHPRVEVTVTALALELFTSEALARTHELKF